LAQKLVCNLASLTLGLDLGFKSRR
jgi:hypothetical protein